MQCAQCVCGSGGDREREEGDCVIPPASSAGSHTSMGKHNKAIWSARGTEIFLNQQYEQSFFGIWTHRSLPRLYPDQSWINPINPPSSLGSLPRPFRECLCSAIHSHCIRRLREGRGRKRERGKVWAECAERLTQRPFACKSNL